MDSSAPIGVFDSGLGGLSVLKTMYELLPSESFIYVGDHRYLPYGDKSNAQILDRSFAISDFLIQNNAKALVMACNTATAVAVNEMRRKIQLPIIAMEPALKPAISHSNSGTIGVLATARTLGSYRFADLIQRLSDGVQIVTQACSGLVEAIERAGPTAAYTQEMVGRYTDALLEQNVDTIVLGCTHYSFVRCAVEKLAGKNVRVLDAGAAVAQQLARRLADHQLLAKQPLAERVQFYTSSDPCAVQQSVGRLWGIDSTVQKLPEQYCHENINPDEGLNHA